jgi:hypothetical protein
MKEFVPVTNSELWLFALEAHNAAVDAWDLDVASEQRCIIDSQRHKYCLECRSVTGSNSDDEDQSEKSEDAEEASENLVRVQLGVGRNAVTRR